MRNPLRRSPARWLVLLTLSAMSTPALATGVPVEIEWEKIKPIRILHQTQGGTDDLRYDSARKTFTGMLDVPDRSVQVHTLFVDYGGKKIPLYLKVNSFLPKVSFRLSLERADSCKKDYVDAVDRAVSTWPDALGAMLGASQLLNIQSPNDCGMLETTVVRARYNRTVQLAQLSKGLFQIDDELRVAFVNSFTSDMRGHAEATAKAYADQIEGLEAAQLIELRNEAQGQRDFTTAADISSMMLERISANPDLRAKYAGEGITPGNLKADMRYLDSRALQKLQSTSSLQGQ